MQSTYEKGCDEVTDDSGAIDICAHCASEDKLQPGLYYCYQCGSFGRYMCGDCNMKHRKYAHEVKSLSDAAQQKEHNIFSFERGCDASEDDSGATDICAHCASESNIQPAFYFCFHCGPFGRHMCENCNKQHTRFANAHEVRKLSKEAQQTREMPMISPTPRQRPVPALRTKAKVEMPQFVSKSMETVKIIKDSGRTDNAVDNQAKTPAATENVQSSYSVKVLKAMFELQTKQGNSPYKQMKVSKVTETKKLDGNVEKVEQKIMNKEIQAVEKETDFVNSRELTMIPPTPKQRVPPDMRTNANVEMPQLVTESLETGEIIKFSGQTDNAVDNQAKTPSSIENVMSSKSEELKTMPVLQRVQGMYPYKQRNILKIRETRKHDHSNVEQVEQQAIKLEIQAAEKETDFVNRSKLSDTFYFVVAINIGTTNSGYAFSGIDMFQKDPLKIDSESWCNGNGCVSHKNPTCVLFDKNKKFHSFGFEAEEYYSELALADVHKDYYFFRRFMRTLFDKMQPKQKKMIEDEIGKQMDAMDVFSASIKFLRQHFLDKILLSNPIKDKDIRWVLTEPEFSNDASKQFIRESAQKTGIDEERLLIATEPEAAIMLAGHLPVNSLTTPDGRFISLAPKSKCLVFDAGGYTIKITVHEIKDNHTVQDLYKTSDLKFGSTNVDQAFRDFLATIVGNDIMDDFQHNNMLDYNEMFKEFDSRMKRNIENDKKEKMTLQFPATLLETFENAKGIRISDHLKTKPEYNDKVSLVGNKLRIDPNIVKGLFQETFDKIASHLKSLFSKPEVKDVQNILMVGEFSELPLLQAFIKKTFPNKRIIIPQDASLSVLKGAVILGHVLGRTEQKIKYYNYTHI